MPHNPNPLFARIRKLSAPMQVIPPGINPRVSQVPGIRAVLFDLYGTLLISGSGDVGTATAIDSATAVCRAMAAAGWDGVSPETCACAIQTMQSAITAEHRRKIAAGAIKPEVAILRTWQEVIVELQAAGRIPGPATDDSLNILALQY